MRIRALLLVLALALLGSCRALPPPAPAPEASAQEIVSRLKSRQEGLATFTGRGRLTLLSPKQNATGSAILRGKLPQTLQVEVYDFLGRAQFSLATDNREMEIFFPREGKYFKGPATPANLAAFIPPGITIPQALRLLTGDLPLSQEPPARLRYEAQEQLYVLEWLNPDGTLRERLWVEAAGFTPRREEWYGAGGPLVFRAELGEYDGLVPGRPQQLKIQTPANGGELRLTYKEFTLNPPLTPADLSVAKPPGVTELPLKP